MKSNEMREILIRKGTELFYNKGFARSSIRDIGRSAGISSATLYHYFKNKDKLLYEIIEDIGGHLQKLLNQTTLEFSDPEERLKMMIFRQICLLKEKREEVKIYMEEQYQLPRRLKEIIHQQHRKLYDTYMDELKRLSKTNRLRIRHLPTINFAIFAMMNWVYRWYKEDKPLPIEEIADMIITILFSGFLLPSKRLKEGSSKVREAKRKPLTAKPLKKFIR